MIDVANYKHDSKLEPISSLMLLVDAVYFHRFNASTNKINHRLALLFYHKRKNLNKKGSLWDTWIRVLYLLPIYRDNKITEFSKFFMALTDQELKGSYDDETLARIGEDVVNEVKNHNYVFKIEWVKLKKIYVINRIYKNEYIIERPSIVEWPKNILAFYPEIAMAQSIGLQDP
jgi:hypothetical protein